MKSKSRKTDPFFVHLALTCFAGMLSWEEGPRGMGEGKAWAGEIVKYFKRTVTPCDTNDNSNTVVVHIVYT